MRRARRDLRALARLRAGVLPPRSRVRFGFDASPARRCRAPQVSVAQYFTVTYHGYYKYVRDLRASPDRVYVLYQVRTALPLSLLPPCVLAAAHADAAPMAPPPAARHGRAMRAAPHAHGTCAAHAHARRAARGAHARWWLPACAGRGGLRPSQPRSTRHSRLTCNRAPTACLPLGRPVRLHGAHRVHPVRRAPGLRAQQRAVLPGTPPARFSQTRHSRTRIRTRSSHPIPPRLHALGARDERCERRHVRSELP